MERIEKSRFKKGKYIGYGSNGGTYLIHKDTSSGYWIAIIHAGGEGRGGGNMSAKPNSFYSKTLSEADKKLGKL